MSLDLQRVFDEGDENIRSDVLLIIIEHLHKEKLFNAAHVLEDEVSSKLGAVNSKRVKVMKFHKAILNGDWDNSVKLLSSLVPKCSQRCFLYYILRQQYLELIDNGEQERAFPFLIKHLKPLEDIAVSQRSKSEESEFKDLCYLLTCTAIGEAEGAYFREWKHYYHQRELLADQLVGALHKHMQDDSGVLSYGLLPVATAGGGVGGSSKGKSKSSRLIDLLKQGFAYQVEAQSDIFSVDNSCESHAEMKSKEPMEVERAGLEYPVVRRVLTDYFPTVYPSKACAILTTDMTDSEAPPSETHSEEEIEATGCINNESTISSFVFTSSRQNSTESINAVGGGNAGVLYGWSFDCVAGKKGGGPEIHNPVWKLRLDHGNSKKPASSQVTKRNSSDHGRYRYCTKIREVCCNGDGTLVAASRSDGGVTLLSRRSGNSVDESATVQGYNIAGQVRAHDGDAYALALYPSGDYMLSGGFDCHVAATDVETMQILKVFYGHTAAVTQVGCNRAGNLVFSSSRDGSVIFWDLLSGVSVRSLAPYSQVSISKQRSLQTQQPQQSHFKAQLQRPTPLLPSPTPYMTGHGYSQTFHPSSTQATSLNGPSAEVTSLSGGTSTATGGNSGGVPQGNVGPNVSMGSTSNSPFFTGNDSQGLGGVSSIRSSVVTGGGEITSCSLSEDGNYLLVSSRFLPAKLIDLRTGNVLMKYKNSAKGSRGYGSTNMFFRPSFCARDEAVMGGSSPGRVALWSTQSGTLKQTLSLSLKNDVSHSPGLSPMLRRLNTSDFFRSSHDRFTGMTGSISTAGIVLWS